jgi:hypothetical protein
MFKDINKKQTTERAMQNLRQKGAAIAYATKF